MEDIHESLGMSHMVAVDFLTGREITDGLLESHRGHAMRLRSLPFLRHTHALGRMALQVILEEDGTEIARRARQ
jgi:hypothetical protein